MLNMSKKNGVTPPREGTAAAVREAARSSAPSPAPAAPERPKRRTFTAEYKLSIVRKADAALASGDEGAVGRLLRGEGLYSSHLTSWRRERDAGELAGLTPRKRGRKPSRSALTDENEQLRRRVAKLEDQVRKSEIIIDVQKKVAALLGHTLDQPTEEDFARSLPSRRRR